MFSKPTVDAQKTPMMMRLLGSVCVWMAIACSVLLQCGHPFAARCQQACARLSECQAQADCQSACQTVTGKWRADKAEIYFACYASRHSELTCTQCSLNGQSVQKCDSALLSCLGATSQALVARPIDVDFKSRCEGLLLRCEQAQKFATGLSSGICTLSVMYQEASVSTGAACLDLPCEEAAACLWKAWAF